MTDAREIIAQTLGHHPGWSRTTDAILAALTAAGFRIVGPGEVDAETVEKCAEVIEILARQLKENDRFLKPEGVSELAAALRALKEKQP